MCCLARIYWIILQLSPESSSTRSPKADNAGQPPFRAIRWPCWCPLPRQDHSDSIRRGSIVPRHCPARLRLCTSARLRQGPFRHPCLCSSTSQGSFAPRQGHCQQPYGTICLCLDDTKNFFIFSFFLFLWKWQTTSAQWPGCYCRKMSRPNTCRKSHFVRKIHPASDILKSCHFHLLSMLMNLTAWINSLQR